MAKVDMNLIKQLRARTSAGLADCKKALEEAEGDLEKAIEILRKKGIAKAVKKAGRATNEGRVAVAKNDNEIAMVLLTCETDFVAKNEQFKEFVENLANKLLEVKTNNLEEFLKSKGDHGTIEDDIKEFIGKLGENMSLAGVFYYKADDNEFIGHYLHGHGVPKMAVAVVLEAKPKENIEGLEKLAHDLAVQIAANEPEFLTLDEVPEDLKKKELEIAKEQLSEKDKNKPEDILNRILEGKVKKVLAAKCFLEQEHAWENMKISQFIAQRAKEIGEEVKVKLFKYLKVGE